MIHMNMRCKKCGGRIFEDDYHYSSPRVELSCLRCGKHWFISKTTNALGRLLAQK